MNDDNVLKILNLMKKYYDSGWKNTHYLYTYDKGYKENPFGDGMIKYYHDVGDFFIYVPEAKANPDILKMPCVRNYLEKWADMLGESDFLISLIGNIQEIACEVFALRAEISQKYEILDLPKVR